MLGSVQDPDIQFGSVGNLKSRMALLMVGGSFERNGYFENILGEFESILGNLK